jgi:Bacteriocin-protection, YdeI or OmpD-Associated/Domain of unknown function (DUF1905)
VFGSARPPVRCTINGVEYRSRLAVYDGRAYLGLRKEVREAAGIVVGDRIDVVIELDEEPREVRVPTALGDALQRDEQARMTFERLAYTHRREYARWIDEAKAEETRDRRVRKAIDMLREGVKHP